jgi:hypothetical protein
MKIIKSGTVYTLLILAAAILLSAPLQNGFCGDPPQWRAEFDETCAYTTDAMALSIPDLQSLIAKCEKLQKTMEQLDETTRKVFLKRILMCKNLYQYVLDAKKREPGKEGQ